MTSCGGSSRHLTCASIHPVYVYLYEVNTYIYSMYMNPYTLYAGPCTKPCMLVLVPSTRTSIQGVWIHTYIGVLIHMYVDPGAQGI